jgi:hypothetical protein
MNQNLRENCISIRLIMLKNVNPLLMTSNFKTKFDKVVSKTCWASHKIIFVSPLADHDTLSRVGRLIKYVFTKMILTDTL